MVRWLSQLLMIGLGVYSYLQIATPFPENGAHLSGAAAPVLFAIQLLVTLIFFVIPFFPESVHFGSRRLTDYAPDQLERIMPLFRDMIGLMGLFMAVYFSASVHLFAEQAESPSPREAARAIVSVMPWLTGGLLVAETFLVFYYLRRFDSAADDSG